jgi:hypothetical protein
MKLINTRTHGIMDYTVGIFIAASPWIFNYAKPGTMPSLIPVLIGLAGVAYSLLTNYEFGAVKMISMRTHLALDILSGLVLAASPWIFGFTKVVFIPHLVLGLVEIGAAAMTESRPKLQHRQVNA